jgi:predicted MFS family arabinose efflux permease
MLRTYIKFNSKLSPFYLLFGIAMIVGILLAGDKDTYVRDMTYVILQIWGLIAIPNVIYLVIKRKQDGILKSFFGMMFLIPIPYIIIAVVMRFLYL